jgi:coenzyme F420-reducing hydrogenase alpha subunit
MKNKTIKVDLLARVEGEGGLFIKVKENRVTEVQLKIFEPPRFFEAFLRGRGFQEASDITSRICGICPVAYQMSATHAMEDACGVKVEGALRNLRRLIYCGEWIESHALHIYLLHAPDFLGYSSGVEMATDHPYLVHRGLQLKKAGNEIIALLGGRSVHPVNVRLGGFFRLPKKEAMIPLAEKLRWAREAAIETVRWTATFPFPDFEREYTFVSLRHPLEYPMNEGRLISNKGLDIPVSEYDSFFEELQVPHSTALHSVLKGGGNYFVGPMARYSLNFDRFSPDLQERALSAGLGPVCKNPFKSIIVRSLEMLYACEEALRLVEEYIEPPSPRIEVQPRAATGYGCTEAPRGILYHRYQIDENGNILDARIIPPTSQNQKTIEEDLSRLVSQYMHLPHRELTLRCEQAIRNYDPCISCATHYLKVEVENA